MSLGDTSFWVAAFLYLLPLVALVLIVRRALRRHDQAAEERAEPISREELERRYSEGRLSREEYLTVRSEILKEEDARTLRRNHDA